ncbi:MAG: HlyD family secretion protein [Bacteroidetes bacterium]|nr:HlyD family secretion protein [Bacteroidota bacterium]
MKESEKAPKKKSKFFIIVLSLLLILGGWFGISKYVYSLHHEDTDDAQVEANISPVISKIPGYITKVFVDDNQFVHKGDTLLTLDQRDLKIVLAQAEAALATAKSNLASATANSYATSQNVHTSNAAITTANAQIEAAKVNVWRATEDYQRYANLIKDHSITQQQYEQALAAKQLAERQLQVLMDQKNQAAAQKGIVISQSTATASQIGVAESIVKQREVDVENAKLNLSYTTLVASENGIVSKVNLQEGQFLQAGQLAFSIVLNSDKWVVANFKETQYDEMHVGQKVIVHADAFPKHDFDAVLSSFSPATGSKFALLPPDNASGNFVKVVQRLPVKINFTNKQDTLIQKLRPGMNVDVVVELDQ